MKRKIEVASEISLFSFIFMAMAAVGSLMWEFKVVGVFMCIVFGASMYWSITAGDRAKAKAKEKEERYQAVVASAQTQWAVDKKGCGYAFINMEKDKRTVHTGHRDTFSEALEAFGDSWGPWAIYGQDEGRGEPTLMARNPREL